MAVYEKEASIPPVKLIAFDLLHFPFLGGMPSKPDCFVRLFEWINEIIRLSNKNEQNGLFK